MKICFLIVERNSKRDLVKAIGLTGSRSRSLLSEFGRHTLVFFDAIAPFSGCEWIQDTIVVQGSSSRASG